MGEAQVPYAAMVRVAMVRFMVEGASDFGPAIFAAWPGIAIVQAGGRV